jgi:hypothetical protein
MGHGTHSPLWLSLFNQATRWKVIAVGLDQHSVPQATINPGLGFLPFYPPSHWTEITKGVITDTKLDYLWWPRSSLPVPYERKLPFLGCEHGVSIIQSCNVVIALNSSAYFTWLLYYM